MTTMTATTTQVYQVFIKATPEQVVLRERWLGGKWPS